MVSWLDSVLFSGNSCSLSIVPYILDTQYKPHGQNEQDFKTLISLYKSFIYSINSETK